MAFITLSGRQRVEVVTAHLVPCRYQRDVYDHVLRATGFVDAVLRMPELRWKAVCARAGADGGLCRDLFRTFKQRGLARDGSHRGLRYVGEGSGLGDSVGDGSGEGDSVGDGLGLGLELGLGDGEGDGLGLGLGLGFGVGLGDGDGCGGGGGGLEELELMSAAPVVGVGLGDGLGLGFFLCLTGLASGDGVGAGEGVGEVAVTVYAWTGGSSLDRAVRPAKSCAPTAASSSPVPASFSIVVS